MDEEPLLFFRRDAAELDDEELLREVAVEELRLVVDGDVALPWSLASLEAFAPYPSLLPSAKEAESDFEGRRAEARVYIGDKAVFSSS